MRQIFLLLVVLLVFAHHQGSCGLESEDAPYSTVRRLSASRQLGGFNNILGDDPDVGDSIKFRSTRPLFSWDLITVAPTGSVLSPKLETNNKTTNDSGDSFVEKRKHRGRKKRNKKKKKKKDMSVEDEASPWHSSNSSTLGTDGNPIVPDTSMNGVRKRKKHKNRQKKERGMSKAEDVEKHVMKETEMNKKEKKQNLDKSRDEKIKKEKKKKKGKKKQRQEIIRQQQENMKSEEGKQKLNTYFTNTSLMEISEKSRLKSKLNQEINTPELIPVMPPSSESDSGIYKKRAHHHVNNGKSSDDNSELLKNEITTGDLTSLYTPQNKDSVIHIMKESTDDNEIVHEISLPSVNEKTNENVKNSSIKSQKENEISPPIHDIISSTKSSVPSSEKTVSINNTNIVINNNNNDQNVTRTESELTMTKNETVISANELEYSTVFEFETTTEHSVVGDLSCLNDVFLPAPPVSNAEIKYMRGKYLEAEYECLPNYKLEPESAPRLICKKRQWLGELPHCHHIIKNKTSGILNLFLNNKIINGSESCGRNRGGCDQLCTLVEGKPMCSCFRGFRLEGSTCHDIDECSSLNGGCEVSCHNKPGSYHCGCPNGFRLAANGKTCLDINECLLRNGHGPCQDTCQNLPGSYACSCEGIEGTLLAADNHTCEDLDECVRNNAGCSHTCLNTLGRAFCLCPLGFMLGTDWKTCHDIDECADPELQEGEHCAIGCINTLGSYQCIDLRDQASNEYHTTTLPPTTVTEAATTIAMTEATTLTTLVDTTLPISTPLPTPMECLPGFERGPFGSCKDVDECDTNNGGCSHTCKNTLGSAFCLCPPGFMLANDWKTCKEMDVRTTEKPIMAVNCPPGHVPTLGGRCKDIDECRILNGGCMQGCVNIKGSFRCICGRGFFLAADGKTCVEERVDIVCPPLPTPSYGYLHCTRRVFMVAPERWRARWRRRIVNHAGAVCELRCPHGYKVHGEYRKVCESNGNWAGPENGFCMPLKAHHITSNEIPQVGPSDILRGWCSWYGFPSHNSRNYIHVTYAFPKPKIECPHNISMQVEPGQATAFVTFPQPITDVDWFRNVVSKPSWGKLLEADLPIGHWTITFTAHHPISRHTASCTLSITINSSALSTEAPKGLA